VCFSFILELFECNGVKHHVKRAKRSGVKNMKKEKEKTHLNFVIFQNGLAYSQK